MNFQGLPKQFDTDKKVEGKIEIGRMNYLEISMDDGNWNCDESKSKVIFMKFDS